MARARARRVAGGDGSRVQEAPAWPAIYLEHVGRDLDPVAAAVAAGVTLGDVVRRRGTDMGFEASCHEVDRLMAVATRMRIAGQAAAGDLKAARLQVVVEVGRGLDLAGGEGCRIADGLARVILAVGGLSAESLARVEQLARELGVAEDLAAFPELDYRHVPVIEPERPGGR